MARRYSDFSFTSCEAQKIACLEFIASRAEQGWIPIVEDFNDEGQSGQTLERPAFFRLLLGIYQRQVDCVVVHRLDRLTRSVADWAELRFYFQISRIKLAVASGNLLLEDNAISVLQFNTLATAAEFEREMISERVADAHATHHARGLRSAGRIPFGYKSCEKTKQLLISPNEAPIVTLAYELAASNLKPNQIAKTLNNRQFPSHLGRQKWLPRTVLRLLRNKTYLGCMVDGSPSTHKPIVPEELFNQVQRNLDNRRTRPTKPRPSKAGDDPFLLRGLLVCRECGETMTTTSSQALKPARQSGTARRQPKLYYRCRGEKPCSHVPAELVETELLKTLTEPPPYLSAPLRKMLKGMAHLWPLLIHANKRKLLIGYLDKIIWYPDIKKLTPVPADDLKL